jgi:hypothetical protein
VSTIRQAAQDTAVSAATIAEWRRRQQDSSQEPGPADGHGNRTNSCPAVIETATCSADSSVRSFAESQGAGLAAIISLANTGVLPRLLPVESTTPLPGRADSTGEVTDGRRAPPRMPDGLPAVPPADDLALNPGQPAATASRRLLVAGTHASQERQAVWSDRFAHPTRLWLIVILTVQACLSARLLQANTAFQDEALYLWAGRLELSHWLHGTSIPLFPAYFSGAPVMYPPLDAFVASIGGLTGSRILSLCFMLGTTVLLWGTAGRLFGRRTALFAAGLFAILGPTQFLGAFATFDAMSLFLLALATWCAVHGAGRAAATRWMVGCAAALVLANVTTYSSVMFDPIIIAIAVLSVLPRSGGKAAAGYGASIATYVAAALVTLVTLGGGHYWAGITSTTLTRAQGTDRAAVVFAHSWAWIGVVIVAAGAGIVFCIIRDRSMHNKLILLSVLALAGIVVPLGQAQLHTTTSLQKHVDVGAWFAVIAAGYAVDKFVTLFGPRPLRAVILAGCTVVLVAAAFAGMAQAQALFGEWPNDFAFVNAFRPLVAADPGRLLVETASGPEYYLHDGDDWKRWSSTFSIVLPSGRAIGHQGGITDAGSPQVYARYIARGYFALVALNFQGTPQLDTDLANDLDHDAAYHLIASTPYGQGRYLIWEYEPNRLGNQ